MNQRIKYIDTAKGIGIILVVIGHCLSPDSIVRHMISSFHMPLFFFLSGFVFNLQKNKDFKPFAIKRIRQLLIPTLYFTFIISILSNMCIDNFHINDITYRLPGALWFLPILFLTEIMYWILANMKKHIGGELLVILSCTIGLVLSHYKVEFPYSLSSTFLSIFYFGLGDLSKKYIKHSSRSNMIYICIGILLLAVPVAYVIITKDNVSFSENKITLYSLIVSCFGIGGIIAISKVAEHINLLLYLGNSFRIHSTCK